MPCGTPTSSHTVTNGNASSISMVLAEMPQHRQMQVEDIPAAVDRSEIQEWALELGLEDPACLHLLHRGCSAGWKGKVQATSQAVLDRQVQAALVGVVYNMAWVMDGPPVPV